MSTLDLRVFSGPLTAVALNEWLQECLTRTTRYMNDNKIFAKDRFLIDHIGDKISDEGVTHDLATWYHNSGYLIEKWDDFREAIMIEALGPAWLSRAIADLYKTKQDNRSAGVYIRDLKEKLSVLKQSVAANSTVTRPKLPLDEKHFKYLMLFNADPAVTERILDSGFDILDATSMGMEEKIGQASHTPPPPAVPDENETPTRTDKPRSSLTALWTKVGTYHFSDYILCVALSPDNSVMAVSSSASFWMIDIESERVLSKVDAAKGAFKLAFPNSDCLVLEHASSWGPGMGRELHVWQWRTTAFEKAIFLAGFVWESAVFPDGKRILVRKGGQLIIYSLITFKEELSISNWGPSTSRAVFSLDCNLAAFPDSGGSSVKGFQIYDIPQRKIVHTISIPGGAEIEPSRTVLSPDGTHIAFVTRESCVRVWSLEEGREIWRLPCQDRVSVIYSPDGLTLACTLERDVVTFRDAKNGAETTAFEGTELGIHRRVVFSPDGTLLATSPRLTPSSVVIRRATWGGNA